MTMGSGSSVVNGEQRTVPEGFQSTVPSDNYDDNDEPPSYEESTVAGSSSSASAGPSRLYILGATWGGVNVTADVRNMVALDKSKSFQLLKLNMHTVHLQLLPDPAPAIVKTLTVLYRYDSDAPETVQLLNAPQFAPQITVKVTPSAAAAASESKLRCGLPRLFVGVIKTEKLWRDPEGKVEIIAVLYGTKRIETQSVLGELGQFLGGGASGQRQQVRTTANFFQSTSPQIFVPLAKSWTVYFRLLQSQDPAKVRCVTGMQDGALEVPWMD